MAETVDVIHPSPLRFVRQGARRREADCVRIRTPVSLVDADPRGFRATGIEAGHREGLREIHEHEGAPWVRVMVSDPMRRRRPLRATELTSWLSDPSYETDIVPDIPGAFEGTPFVQSRVECARHRRGFSAPGERVVWRTTFGRGAPEGEVLVRTVIDDGESAARRALRAFVERGLRLVGGDVFLRVAPLVRIVPDGTVYGTAGDAYLEALTHLPANCPELVARPDRARSLVDEWSDGPGTMRDRVEGIVPKVPAAYLDEAGLGLAANMLPKLAVGLVDAVSGVRLYDPSERQALLDLAEGIRADALLAEIGGVSEWEPATRRAAAALRAFPGLCPKGAETRTAHRLREYAETRVLPHFEAPLEPSDVEAIHAAVGMAP